MKVATALSAVLGVLVLLLLPAATGPASAVPETSSSATAVPDTQAPSRFARIVIDSMTPSIVTTTSRPVVSVSGRVENIGDRSISNLTIRLERGDPIDSASGLRTQLADDDPAVAVAGPFEELTDTLKPGESIGFQMSMPLSDGPGAAVPGLGISRTGVYPVQVNVNGKPDYGDVAQVAGSRMLLPVLSLPPDEVRARDYVDPTAGDAGSTAAVPGLGPDGSISANLSSPARMTLLWPLAAPPQLAPGVLGGNTEPVRLINDDLARSLKSGGRLNELLTALHKVVGEPPREAGSASSAAPASESPIAPEPGAALPGSEKLAESMCLAIDPDLLVTVRAMSLGYEISENPADPTSPTRPGTGAESAARWLDDLRWTAGRMCVVALPFAQADLTSLARIGNSSLNEAALRRPADIVDAILGVKSVRGLSIPALGAIDRTGADVLKETQLGATAVASNSIAPTGRRDSSGRYRVGDLTAQTYEAPITASFAAIGTAPRTPALTPPSQRIDLTDESMGSRRQTAVAALAYPAIAAPRADRPDQDGDLPRSPVVGRSAFLMPPTYWSPTVADAEALFSTARLLLESGAATPTPLTAVVGELATAREQARLTDPPGVGPVGRVGSVLTAEATDAIRRNVEDSWQFEGALVRSADVAATPARYMSPLREDQLRAIRSPDAEGAGVYTHLRRQQEERIKAVESTLHRLTRSVNILDPGGRYTLASERSPVLLAVRNDLALPVRARLGITAPEGVEIGDLGVIEIPARGTRQIQLPTRGETSEAITVEIRLDTVTGVSLGDPITLQVHTNAYGKPLFYITIAAGVALVLLTARRLWHRFRGQPDPADADRPEPDELERMLAGSGYQERRRTLQGEGHPPGDESNTDPHDP
ncbi:DUF6049 family protein [Gordonia aurantiaca]